MTLRGNSQRRQLFICRRHDCQLMSKRKVCYPMSDNGIDQIVDSAPQCRRCDAEALSRSRFSVSIYECTGCGESVSLDWAPLELRMGIDTAADTGLREAATKAKFRVIFGREARLSWVLAMLGGLIGATAFTHSAGYFVTFMTGNSDRAVLGFFRNEPQLSIGAALILASFIGGVVVASLCRRHLWLAHPHGPTVLTALTLMVAAVVDIAIDGWSTSQVSFVPVLFLAFAIGALNTSFVNGGEVSVPLSYVTGTLVKMGQGIERHVSGGDATEWLSYFLLWFSFVAGGAIGGGISLLLSGCQMLVVAALACTAISGYTHFHGDRRALLRE